MISLIGILKMSIFVVGLIGYIYIVYDRFKLDFCFTPIVTFSIITLMVYLGGLVGKLQLMIKVIPFVGLIFFIYFLIRRPWEKGMWQFISFFHLFFVIGSVCFLILLLNTKFIHYDNFSHWGIVVKDMLCTEAFPTAESVMIEFSNYPLGMACWIYYVCKWLGNGQEMMLWAQGLIIFACFYAMFGIIQERKRFLLYAFMGAGLSLLSIFNISIRMNNLLVDFILPILVLATFSILYFYRENLGRAALGIIPILGLLGIVKSTGIIFMIFGLLYFIYLILRTSKGRKRYTILPFIGTVMFSFIPTLLWKVHMKLNFSGVTNKFEVSVDHLQKGYGGKTPDEIREIILLYIKSACNFSTRATIGIVLFEIVAIIACIIASRILKKKWALGKALIALDIMLVSYYVGILAMYIFSMPLDEALYLAEFERYASSIVVLFCGSLILCATVDIENSFHIKMGNQYDYRAFKSVQTKKYYQSGVITCITLAIIVLLSEYNGMKYNNKLYAQSLPKKVEAVTGDRWMKGGVQDTSRYLFYASDKEGQITNYYLQYVARYMLYTPNVDAICLFYEDNMENLLQNYDYLVVVESDAIERYLMKKHFGVDGKNGIYTVKDLLRNKV